MSSSSPQCSICNWKGKHHHSDKQIHQERHVRPAFERMIVERYRESALWRGLLPEGSGYSFAPSPEADGTVHYAQAFGWHGAPRKQNADGSELFGEDHWAYRAGVSEPYLNVFVEKQWQVFRDCVEVAPTIAPLEQ